MLLAQKAFSENNLKNIDSCLKTLGKYILEIDDSEVLKRSLHKLFEIEAILCNKLYERAINLSKSCSKNQND